MSGGESFAFNARSAGTLLLTLARILLGAWMVVNGLNHFLPIFPQPLGSFPKSSELQIALIESGLFDVVKSVEVLGGAMLILNRFVPLALVLLMPVSTVVYYNDAVLQHRWNRLLYMGTGCFYLNIILLVAYSRHYLPMLSFRADFCRLSDLKRLSEIFKS
jgi:uncharacterized membrane protein YphA (DoxX/SURF4 family)